MTDHDKAVFTMARVFEASRDRVWRAWSEAEQLTHWWGPKGCSVEVLRLEFRPGGLFHYAMNFDNGTRMWGRFNYREIDAPKRMVWLNSFANEGCGIARAPFSEDCPLEVENTVTFAGDGETTTVTLRAEPFGALAAERAYFAALFPSLEIGYGGTFEQLGDWLGKV
jgi:uncharacterized protein YndB with AHSA1/START domain